MPVVAAGLRALAAAGLLAASGCAAWEHTRALPRYAGRTLAASSEEGVALLALESRHDVAVAEAVARHGRPDYVRALDTRTLYLYYLAPERVLAFARGVPYLEPTEVEAHRPIPGVLLRELPGPAQRRVLARRESRAPRATSRSPRAAPPAAAAPAPSGGWSRRAFDAKALVERFRVPMTAADAGVSGWRAGRLADGAMVYTATSGRVRYEVGGSRIAVVTRLGARTTLPGDARLAMARVNEAVFAAKAGRVQQAFEPLAEQVARDPSGRTQVARRVAGRTVRVWRATGGKLVYAVEAD